MKIPVIGGKVEIREDPHKQKQLLISVADNGGCDGSPPDYTEIAMTVEQAREVARVVNAMTNVISPQ